VNPRAGSGLTGCARIEAPGTLDGGDVLKVGSTAYVGRGWRTNAEGIGALRRILSPRGWTVVAAPRTTALLRDLGHEVVTVDVTEFEKLEGCVTCLSVRIRD
jgi:N-dimethylarginine dimethylaminohydrolase